MRAKKVNSNIEKYFVSRITERQEKLNDLVNYLKDILNEAKLIDSLWESIVENHSKKNSTLKLIIVGEAPQEFKKYFYYNQGTFLNSLKDYWKLNYNNLLPDKMLEKRVLVLDVYKYPLPPEFYEKDKDKVLFDESYINGKLKILQDKGLLDDNTHFVFRYKHLFEKRELHEIGAFNNCKFIKNVQEIVSLNTEEIPQKLNTTVQDYLNINCS